MDGNKLQIQFAIKELSTSSSLIKGAVARALMIFIIDILGINFDIKYKKILGSLFMNCLRRAIC
jgi:hypothetical protein